MFNGLLSLGFDIIVESHAAAILELDFPTAEKEIEAIMKSFSIESSEIVSGGGGEASMTQRLRKALASAGWKKENFTIITTVNGIERESTTHEIDHVKKYEKGTIALEIEWNNKDTFFDRDLENFNRLHDNRAISLGIIVTRGESLQANLNYIIAEHGERYGLDSFKSLEDHGYELTKRKKSDIQAAIDKSGAKFIDAWAKNYFQDKYGEATTHWRKLKERIARGVGHPCPLIGIGIPSTLVKNS